MANILKNQKVDRLKTYDGVFRIQVGGDTFQLIFIQDFEYNFDDEFLERDRIDDGSSVFSRLGDVLGRFSFRIKNTIDMYDSAVPAVNTTTISFWIEQLIKETPAVLSFLIKHKAPESTGNKFANVIYQGRIMKVTPDRIADRAIEEGIVEGEITGFTSAKREAT